MASKKIRDFIYVDSDTLYSLYSQVFEGVAEKIAVSSLDQKTISENTPMAGGSGKNAYDTKFIEAYSRNESRILLDHLYAQLEEKIAPSILEMKGDKIDSYREILEGSFLVKVCGMAEIEDYERVKNFTQKFNSIGEAVAYANIAGDDVVKAALRKNDLIEHLEHQIKNSSGSRKSELSKQLSDIKKWIEVDVMLKLVQDEVGLRLDQRLLNYLDEWFTLFYPNGFEITISPTGGNGEVVFRGVIDTQFLRLNPQYLRAIFGNFLNSEWVMVGQVTYFPGTKLPDVGDDLVPVVLNQEEGNEVQEIDNSSNDPLVPLIEKMKKQAENNEQLAMRDSVKKMFGRVAEFDKMFFESKERVELLVRPLAIYREFDIQVKEDNEIL